MKTEIISIGSFIWDVKDKLESSGKSISRLSIDVSKMGSNVINLKEKIENYKTKKIITVENEPSCNKSESHYRSERH